MSKIAILDRQGNVAFVEYVGGILNGECKVFSGGRHLGAIYLGYKDVYEVVDWSGNPLIAVHTETVDLQCPK